MPVRHMIQSVEKRTDKFRKEYNKESKEKF